MADMPLSEVALTSATLATKLKSPLDNDISSLALEDWLALSFIKGVGPARLDRFSQYIDIMAKEFIQSHAGEELNKTNLVEFADLNIDTFVQLKWPVETAEYAAKFFLHGYLADEVRKKLDQTLDWVSHDDHSILLKNNPLYPEELKHISVAPTILYLKGDSKSLLNQKLGIVGARKCTAYGREQAYVFAQQLAENGLSIVSGGAIGIDSSAHMGALSAYDQTIAVMGSGLLNLYPKTNIGLFNRILDNGGALVSEYPLSTQVQPHLFPPRNRIISGLSKGVFVVEAESKSGSLISASYALQQNREVFALPGRMTDRASMGCLDLIKQGAKLVTCVEDIISEFPDLKTRADQQTINESRREKTNGISRETIQKNVDNLSSSQTVEEAKKQINWREKDIGEIAKNVMLCVDKANITHNLNSRIIEFDELIEVLTISAAELSQALMELELEGIIESYLTGYRICFE